MNRPGTPIQVDGVPYRRVAEDPAENTQVEGVRVVDAPEPPSPKWNRGIYLTGLIQICTGLAAILFNVACTMTTDTVTAFVGPGYWCGLMFLITGCFGVAGYKRKHYGYIVTYMVLSIVSAPLTVALLGVTPYAILESTAHCDYTYMCDGRDSYNCYSKAIMQCWTDNYGVGWNFLLLVCGLVELVVSITASAFCCSAAC